jgi:hypothetical protein
MKVGTILLTYARPKHTKQVLDALRNNTVLPEKLYIFQDGEKETTNHEDWCAVRKYINSIDWCWSKVIFSEYNKGLASSVVDAINYVLIENDAVIVLEDDCVPHKLFMEYMYLALEKYCDVKDIYHVSGSAWDNDVKDNGYDAYFMGRIHSCGWATWKDRWEYYSVDYTLLKKIRKDAGLNEHLEIWGPDLENMLVGNICGINDSWAIFWDLTVMSRLGKVLCPYKSLITNIGYDGSGVHSMNCEFYQRVESADRFEKFHLPEKIEIAEETKNAFKHFFSSASALVMLKYRNDILSKWLYLKCKGLDLKRYLLNENISHISVWGAGMFLDLLYEELLPDIEIDHIIKSCMDGSVYHNIKTIPIERIDDVTQLLVVIPTYDFAVIARKAVKHFDGKIVSLFSLLDDVIKRQELDKLI